MKEQELLAQALELGFANAALIDTGDLIFVPAFRPLPAGLRHSGGDASKRPALAPRPGHAVHVGH